MTILNDNTIVDETDVRHKNDIFKKNPAINVISKEEFENRTKKVFHILWETLSKSFGPYGAPTLICNYPYQHVTKDGFTIMKNLSFDTSETLVDQTISDMAADICGRLNYTVGDGTTSAIIATNGIYQQYLKYKEELDRNMILPRDVIYKFNELKDVIIEKLEKKAKPVRTADLDELYKNIYDVVYISSNGDKLITEYIADLYKELGAPGITCVKAPDGITKKKLIEGYKYELYLADRLYINNDDKTMNLDNADIVIFSTKITENTYKKIIKPLNLECRTRGRHLIVCAPSFDETALSQVISPELNAEYRKTHDVNLVLTRYRAISEHTRRLANDFSVLMNTDIIDREKEKQIIDKVNTGTPISSLFNIDDRGIVGTSCIAFSDEGAINYIHGVDELPEGFSASKRLIPLQDDAIRLGFVRKCSLGLTSSQFVELEYDENRYQAALKEAEDILEETERKYQKLGTFNIETFLCQERLYSLKLKMGIIEVGADSELSQSMFKDAVDDAVKAAESAFKHGIVMGCNLNLLQILDELRLSETDELNKILLGILYYGMTSMYSTVLTNAFNDYKFAYDESLNDVDIVDQFLSCVKHKLPRINISVFRDKEVIKTAIDKLGYDDDSLIPIHSVIIEYSKITNQVFDLSTLSFTDDVINSVQTDIEILKATIDLMAILIVGNQMVVTQKHNF